MIVNLYTMRDRKTGIYASPFVSYTDESAMRDFTVQCTSSKDAYLAEDLELYRLGTFDIKTGEIVHYKPEFIMNGVTA